MEPHSWSNETQTERPIRFPCLVLTHRPVNCNRSKPEALMEREKGVGGGHNHAYVTHTCPHTHARPCSCQKKKQQLFLDCLFGYRKGTRACLRFIVHRGEVEETLNLGGAPPRSQVCVELFPPSLSFFSVRLGGSPPLRRHFRHQQESRGTDKELNWDLLCLKKIKDAGRTRFSLNDGYRMTNMTMLFLHESLWERVSLFQCNS